MKFPTLLCATACLASSAALGAQIIDTAGFYEPEFKVRRAGADSGLLSLTVTNDLETGPAQSSGAMTWEHSAGGHAQIRTDITLVVVPVATADVQLAAYTETRDDSLVFGREITTEVDFLGGVVEIGSELQGVVNNLAGASVLYNWGSTATVSGLTIVPDQLYRVTFDVTSGAGLPVDLLDSADFGITTSGITADGGGGSTFLNVLDLVSFGGAGSTGQFTLDFQSDQNLSELEFAFAASTGVGVDLLGGTEENQNVLTFSNFQVESVPEPSAMLLSVVSFGLIALRRRR